MVGEKGGKSLFFLLGSSVSFRARETLQFSIFQTTVALPETLISEKLLLLSFDVVEKRRKESEEYGACVTSNDELHGQTHCYNY